MLQHAKFNLVNDTNKLILEKFFDVDTTGGGAFWARRVVEVKCHVQTDSTAWICEETDKSVKRVESQLAELFPRDSWSLSLDFSVNESGVLKVTAQGKILEHLQALMSYGAHESKLKLLLSAHLYSSTDAEQPTAIYRTELHPLVLIENCFDHSTYLDTEGPKAIFSIASVDNVSIWIEGLTKKITTRNSADFLPLVREKALGQEVIIRCKVVSDQDIHSLIHVQQHVLIAQSTVIKTTLDTVYFVDGTSRMISMMNWTKKEVTAFISYLYFGDLEMALKDSTMAITLYEMGHYYGVKSLEQAIKTVLLNLPAEAGPCTPIDCIRLFNAAAAAKDSGMKQMAVDLLYAGQKSIGTILEETEVMPPEMFSMCMKP